MQLQRLADRQSGQHSPKLSLILNRLAIQFQNDVQGLDTGSSRRSRPIAAVDEHSLTTR